LIGAGEVGPARFLYVKGKGFWWGERDLCRKGKGFPGSVKSLGLQKIVSDV